MSEECGIDYGPETHGGFGDHKWKLACEFIGLMAISPYRKRCRRSASSATV